MFNKRPSQEKVAGVSHRYLRRVEAAYANEIDRYRLKYEELDLEEVTLITRSLAASAFIGYCVQPLQAMRKAFLVHARDVEGKAPGEEDIIMYAFNRLSRQKQHALPLVHRRNIRNR